MDPEKPDKPEVRGPTGVTVVEDGEPGFKENIKEEFDLLKKKVQKESVLQEIEELKDPTRTQIYKSMFRVKHEPTPRALTLGYPEPPRDVRSSRCRPTSATATRCASVTRGGWAGSLFICS